MIELKRITALCHGQLYQKDRLYPKDKLYQQDEACFQQRRFVPVNVKKVFLCSNIYYLFNQIPRANGCLITKKGDELVRPVNTDAVKKYLVEKKI